MFVNDVGTSHQDGSTCRHQSHGRYRGKIAVTNGRKLFGTDSMFSVLLCAVFFFLGRGRGNQIGDQRPEKVFTPPQHRHLFRRLHKKESARQRRPTLGNEAVLADFCFLSFFSLCVVRFYSCHCGILTGSALFGCREHSLIRVLSFLYFRQLVMEYCGAGSVTDLVKCKSAVRLNHTPTERFDTQC